MIRICSTIENVNWFHSLTKHKLGQEWIRVRNLECSKFQEVRVLREKSKTREEKAGVDSDTEQVGGY